MGILLKQGKTDPPEGSLQQRELGVNVETDELFLGTKSGIPKLIATRDYVDTHSSGGGGGSVAWGSITGTLSNQSDLNTSLSGKQSKINTTGLLKGSGSGNIRSASASDVPGFTYTTTRPTSNNTSGLKVAVLSSDPTTKYSGWLYFITE